MKHTVPLERFDARVEFPALASGRIRYDAEKRLLEYEGVMYKADFDRLAAVSNDWIYLRALEELFRASISGRERRGRTITPRYRPWPRRLAYLAAAVLLAWLLVARPWGKSDGVAGDAEPEDTHRIAEVQR